MNPEMYIGMNGTKVWEINGHYHREDGPAIEWHDGSKSWYLNGQLHRIEGPAYEDEKANPNQLQYGNRWYLKGKALTQQQHQMITMFNEVHITTIKEQQE